MSRRPAGCPWWEAAGKRFAASWYMRVNSPLPSRVILAWILTKQSASWKLFCFFDSDGRESFALPLPNFLLLSQSGATGSLLQPRTSPKNHPANSTASSATFSISPVSALLNHSIVSATRHRSSAGEKESERSVSEEGSIFPLFELILCLLGEMRFGVR